MIDEMKRLFLGVEIPANIQNRIKSVQQILQRGGVTARWTHPSILHITALFLGQVDTDKLPILEQSAADACRETGPFSITLRSLGMFKRNRILWLDIDDSAQQSLSMLNQALSSAIRQSTDLSLDERPYKAHITLARQLKVHSFEQWMSDTTVSGGLSELKDELEGSKDGEKIAGELSGLSDDQWQVGRLALFESLRIDGRLAYPVRSTFDLLG